MAIQKSLRFMIINKLILKDIFLLYLKLKVITFCPVGSNLV